MLSLFAHALYSAAIGLNTRAHISPSGPWSILPGPVDPAHSTCILRVPRPSRSAVYFFPHTRPPDIQVGLEYLGSLVNTYFSSGLRRIPQRTRRRHRALAQEVWEALLTAFPL